MKSSSVMPKLNTFYQKGYFRGKELSDKYYNDIINRISIKNNFRNRSVSDWKNKNLKPTELKSAQFKNLHFQKKVKFSILTNYSKKFKWKFYIML